MKTSPRVSLTLCRALPIALLTLCQVAAQTLEWDTDAITAGAQGAVTMAGWNSGSLWWNGTTNVAWATGSDAVFGGTAGTVLNDAAVTVDDITFTVPGYVLQANGPDYGIQLGEGEGAHVITVAGNAAIKCRMLGTEGFTKEGAGVLSLGPANHSFIGTITINAGEVKIAGGFIDVERSVALANVPGAMFTVDGEDQIIGGLSGGGAAGGEVRINGSLIVAARNSDVTYDGVISGNGSFTKTGAGTLTLSNPNSTYSGPTYFDEGMLNLNDVADDGIPSPLGLSGYIRMGNGTTLRYSGATSDSTDRQLELVGTTNIEVVSPGATLTWGGRISGGGIIKKGPGTLLLSGSNTYTGSTTVNAGTLKVSGGNAIPDNSQVYLGSGTTLELGGSSETIGNLNVEGGSFGRPPARINLQSGTLRTVTTDSLNIGVSGVISGPGELEKLGTAILVLNSVASISDATLRVSEGTVYVAGSIPSSVPVILGSATTSGTIEHTYTPLYPPAPYLLLDGPLTVSPAGGTLRGYINVYGPIEGTGELTAELYSTWIGEDPTQHPIYGGIYGPKEFGGTLNISSGGRPGAGTVKLSGNWPNAAIKVSGTLIATKSISVRSLEVSGQIFLGETVDADAVTISSRSLVLAGRHSWDLFDASPSGYDHFEVLGPVTLGAVPLTYSGSDLFALRLRFDPVDDVDIIRLVVNDGSDPTVLQNGGGFVIGNKVLQEGERFFLPRFNPGGPSPGPPQEFEIHYGLDSTDNDVRLVAVPEPTSLLTLGTSVTTVLCGRRRSKR